MLKTTPTGTGPGIPDHGEQDISLVESRRFRSIQLMVMAPSSSKANPIFSDPTTPGRIRQTQGPGDRNPGGKLEAVKVRFLRPEVHTEGLSGREFLVCYLNTEVPSMLRSSASPVRLVAALLFTSPTLIATNRGKQVVAPRLLKLITS
ncbi:MAG: hypothetical protein IPL49_11035, partial [Saprospirales bacterium]|nr:hypothetical protein [Saprospirales bacterium]